MTEYVIKIKPNEEFNEASELIDENGQLTRQGNTVLYVIEKYGYSADIEKA